MTSKPRQVVVDDTDSRIVYSKGDWTMDSGSTDGAGNLGPTYLHTSHVTTASGSASFTFSGTGVWIKGTNNQTQIDATHYDPTWTCTLDGSPSPPGGNFTFIENNWSLCGADNLSEGQHTITKQVNNPNGKKAWLDYIKYRPTLKDDATLDGVVRWVEPNDPTFFQFSDGWTTESGGLMSTSTAGASVTFTFDGTSFTWMGHIPSTAPFVRTTLSYTIDDGQSSTVNLLGLDGPGHASHDLEPFFSTPQLAKGTHKCTVTFHGSQATTPLWLQGMYVSTALVDHSSSSASGSGTSGTSGPAPSTIVSVSNGVTKTFLSTPGGSQTALSNNGDTSSSNTPSTPHSSTPVGAIVGGVVGGIVLILAILALLFCYRRRQSRDNRQSIRLDDGPDIIAPFTGAPRSAQSYLMVQQKSPGAQQPSTASDYGNSSSSDFVSSGPASALIPLRKGEEATSGGVNLGTTNPDMEPEVVHHQDSGFRTRPIIEVPPGYTME